MEKYYLVLVSVIPRGFPHYWITGGLWRTPFYLTFIAWQDFSHTPFPHLRPAYAHFALPVRFFRILFWAWAHGAGAGGGEPTTHRTGFWFNVLERSAWLNNASHQICVYENLFLFSPPSLSCWPHASLPALYHFVPLPQDPSINYVTTQTFTVAGATGYVMNNYAVYWLLHSELALHTAVRAS